MKLVLYEKSNWFRTGVWKTVQGLDLSGPSCRGHILLPYIFSLFTPSPKGGFGRVGEWIGGGSNQAKSGASKDQRGNEILLAISRRVCISILFSVLCFCFVRTPFKLALLNWINKEMRSVWKRYIYAKTLEYLRLLYDYWDLHIKNAANKNRPTSFEKQSYC